MADFPSCDTVGDPVCGALYPMDMISPRWLAWIPGMVIMVAFGGCTWTTGGVDCRGPNSSCPSFPTVKYGPEGLLFLEVELLVDNRLSLNVTGEAVRVDDSVYEPPSDQGLLTALAWDLVPLDNGTGDVDRLRLESSSG